MNNVKFIALFFISIFLLISCQQSRKKQNFWTEASSPLKIGKVVVEDLLNHEDFMMYETEDASSVHYAEVCVGMGAARFSGLIKDSVTLVKLGRRYLRVLDDSIINTANHVDANVYGILALELFNQLDDERFLKQGMDLANGQWISPLDNGLTNQCRYWIDDVYMITALQVAAFRVTQDTVFLSRAASTVKDYLEKLQQPNGLFYHGNGAPYYWGRGNGWVAAGLAELLLELDKNNSNYSAIASGYVKMMNALIANQADDGMWRQLIDVEESWKETSSTAMFGFAIHTGVKMGILTGDEFVESYQKAWKALVKYIGPDGKISDVCVGTGKSGDINYYLDRPRTTGDFHGQAPILWFACSLLE